MAEPVAQVAVEDEASTTTGHESIQAEFEAQVGPFEGRLRRVEEGLKMGPWPPGTQVTYRRIWPLTHPTSPLTEHACLISIDVFHLHVCVRYADAPLCSSPC